VRVAIGLLVGLALIAGAVSPVQARHANHHNRHIHRIKGTDAVRGCLVIELRALAQLQQTEIADVARSG
jgi:hypothetical protein